MVRLVLHAISSALIMALGIFIIVRPDNFLAVVTAAFALYLAVDGVRTLLATFRFRQLSRRIVLPAYIKGGVNVALGIALVVIAVRERADFSKWLVYLIAADFLLTAVVDAIEFWLFRKAKEDTGAIGMNAVLSLVLSILLFIFPSISASVFFSVFGALVFSCGAVMLYALINGILVKRRFQRLKKETLQRHTDIYDD